MIRKFILHNEKEAPRRTENVKKLLSMFNDIEVFEAVYPSNFKEEDKPIMDMIMKSKQELDGYVYNYITNIKLLKKCVDEKIDRVLIFEDDSELIAFNTMEQFNLITENMKDTPIIFLGGRYYHRSNKTQDILQTDAVLFNNNKVIKEFLDYLTENKLPLAMDRALNTFCKKRKNRLHIKIFQCPYGTRSTIINR